MTSDSNVATVISDPFLATMSSDTIVAFVILLAFPVPLCYPADVIARDVE
jgi:hypothetical protein